MTTLPYNKSIWWFTLTYQSNNALNVALTHKEHMSAKQVIAKHLVEKLPINEIHSFIHSSIIFSIATDDAIGSYKKIVEVLKKPLAEHNPKLLFTIGIVAKSDSATENYMHIDGSEETDTNFLNSIKEFYPKKDKKFTAK